MQAGVPAIISTLWPVEEISTMLLLQRFYQIYRQDNQPPAIALQQAQYWLRDATAQTLMDFCNQVTDFLPADKQLKYQLLADRYEYQEPDSKPYAHPYYWAGFVFSGAGL
jgi:CHAT domain-containing protein